MSSAICELEPNEVIKMLEPIFKIAGLALEDKPYGIVKERIPIRINNIDGWLVWDYIVWNELTFEYEDKDGTRKLSLFNKINDEETQNKFDELKSKYGI